MYKDFYFEIERLSSFATLKEVQCSHRTKSINICLARDYIDSFPSSTVAAHRALMMWFLFIFLQLYD